MQFVHGGTLDLGGEGGLFARGPAGAETKHAALAEVLHAALPVALAEVAQRGVQVGALAGGERNEGGHRGMGLRRPARCRKRGKRRAAQVKTEWRCLRDRLALLVK